DTVWDKDIADTANGLDVDGKSWVFFDLAAQTRHLHVDRAFERDIEQLAQRLARKGAPGVTGKNFQKLRLARGEPYRRAILAQFAALGIEHRVAHANFAMCLGFRAARTAQKCRESQSQ